VCPRVQDSTPGRACRRRGGGGRAGPGARPGITPGGDMSHPGGPGAGPTCPPGGVRRRKRDCLPSQLRRRLARTLDGPGRAGPWEAITYPQRLPSQHRLASPDVESNPQCRQNAITDPRRHQLRNAFDAVSFPRRHQRHSSSAAPPMLSPVRNAAHGAPSPPAPGCAPALPAAGRRPIRDTVHWQVRAGKRDAAGP
jgi:hypothetical protein